ncbi:MAG: DUF4062 domain-containing protein, partial [Planctomycetota bacterium]
MKQIRADLRDLIEVQIGFDCLISESADFPVDSSVDPIENCRQRVRNDADVLILIIGGRYGHIDSSADRSVTNIEYITARAKGIPIFAFIDRAVLSLLPIWTKNPTADFSPQIEDPKVFNFIREVRDEHRAWCHSFETAQDIKPALQLRLAHLVSESLA